MGDNSKIEWTDATWNPVSGCSKVSQGCKNCYAERVFPRVYGGTIITKGHPPDWTSRKRQFTDVWTHPDRLDQPLRWRWPRRIFRQLDERPLSRGRALRSLSPTCSP